MALVLACGHANAAGDPKQSDEQARKAFERGDYEEAAHAFEQAFKSVPHPATQYNAALSWDRAGKKARAADAFEAALELSGLDEQRARASETRLAELKRSLGTVLFRRPLGATISVLHHQRRPIPFKFHAPPGRHQARVKLGSGRTIRLTIDAEAGQVIEPKIQSGEAGLARGAPPKPPRDTAPKKKGGGAGPWPWVAFGGAAVFSTAAIVLGTQTLKQRDDFVDNHPDDDSERDQAVRLRTLTNVAWGAAIVSGAVGAVLLLSDSGDEPATKSTTARLRHPQRHTWPRL